MMYPSDFPLNFLRSINMSIFAFNLRNDVSKIWILVSNRISRPSIVSNTEQEITLEFAIQTNDFCVTFVYASVLPNTRRGLWDQLRHLSSSQKPWMIMGDFNAVLGAHEKMGGNLPNTRSCEDFALMIEDCNLEVLNTTGSQFTWARKSGSRYVACRLDRALCSNSWIDYWCSVNCSTLPRCNSDHNPIMVVCEDFTHRGPVPFRFKKMWCLNENFKNMVSDCWNSCSTYGGKLRAVVIN